MVHHVLILRLGAIFGANFSNFQIGSYFWYNLFQAASGLGDETFCAPVFIFIILNLGKYFFIFIFHKFIFRHIYIYCLEGLHK